MQVVRWRSTLSRGIGSNHELPWLLEPGSLTLRCQQFCDEFEVQVLRQSIQSLSSGSRIRIPVREVILRCDGVPVIFARSRLLTGRCSRLGRWFERLGKRSLGSLLFRHPGFSRGGMSYARIRPGRLLHRHVCEALGQSFDPLWARRSIHYLDAASLEVTEVFLPAIRSLGQAR